MTSSQPDLDPGGDPPEDDRNDTVADSPAPDPTDGDAAADDDVPEAD